MIGLPQDRVPEWSPLSSELQTDTQQTQTRVINDDSFKNTPCSSTSIQSISTQ